MDKYILCLHGIYIYIFLIMTLTFYGGVDLPITNSYTSICVIFYFCFNINLKCGKLLIK